MPGAPAPGLRIAQILIQARMSEDARRQQWEKVEKVRKRAKSVGLAKAATEAGLTTTKTDFFDFTGGPPEVQDVPEAADWALGVKPGAVSRVFENTDAFTLVSLADRRPAGPGAKTEMMESLRQLAELRKRVLMSKSTADRVAQMVAQGRTLEEAAAAAGATTFRVDSMARMRVDPRFGAVPEVAGAVFGAPIGKTLGPFETPAGWFFVRADARAVADTSRFTTELRGQITQEILQRRQQEFFTNWLAETRAKAKIEDLRGEQTMAAPLPLP